MNEFIGYTTGLECRIPSGRITLIKCEFNRTDSGIVISAVSGRNLNAIRNITKAFITEGEYRDREIDPYNDTVEAIWALGKLGLCPAELEEPDWMHETL